MIKKFTQNDLLRFIYRETPASEGMAIGEALASDADLHADYEALLAARREIPRVQFRPTDATLAAVLRYSRETPALEQC